jgi:hypothetical protein
MAEPNDTTSPGVWTYVGTGSLAAAAVIAAIYAGFHAPTFSWAAAPMVVCYVLGLFSIVSLLALVRKWPFPGIRGISSDTGLHISEAHAAQIRDAARSWSKDFSELVDPDWAVRLIEVANLDSHKDLAMLRRHFPNVNSEYLEWSAANRALRGIPTMPYDYLGHGGNKPTTPEGEAVLKKHNAIARKLAATLGTISGQTNIIGQCDQCHRPARRWPARLVRKFSGLASKPAAHSTTIEPTPPQ